MVVVFMMTNANQMDIVISQLPPSYQQLINSIISIGFIRNGAQLINQK